MLNKNTFNVKKCEKEDCKSNRQVHETKNFDISLGQELLYQ